MSRSAARGAGAGAGAGPGSIGAGAGSHGAGAGGLGGSRGLGGSGIVGLVASDPVVGDLLREAASELANGLTLRQAVDGAVVVVLHGLVTLAARVEDRGDVALDPGAAECVGDIGMGMGMDGTGR